MTGVFTTVEGWLTGDIAEFLGICAIVGLGALIWLAHEYGHMFMYVFRGILAIGVWCLTSRVREAEPAPAQTQLV